MKSLISAETVIVILMLVATMVAIVVRRMRVPYTVSLVLVGLLIAVWRPITVAVTPELILAIFVPPLIFEAAFHLDFRLLRNNLASEVFLAAPGVIVTAVLVGCGRQGRSYPVPVRSSFALRRCCDARSDFRGHGGHFGRGNKRPRQRQPQGARPLPQVDDGRDQCRH